VDVDVVECEEEEEEEDADLRVGGTAWSCWMTSRTTFANEVYVVQAEGASLGWPTTWSYALTHGWRTEGMMVMVGGVEGKEGARVIRMLNNRPAVSHGASNIVLACTSLIPGTIFFNTSTWFLRMGVCGC